jgi:hypothetical protein
MLLPMYTIRRVFKFDVASLEQSSTPVRMRGLQIAPLVA